MPGGSSSHQRRLPHRYIPPHMVELDRTPQSQNPRDYHEDDLEHHAATYRETGRHSGDLARIGQVASPSRMSRHLSEHRSALPSEAVREFFCALQDLMVFCRIFQADFHHEVKGISEYADKKILSRLWALKALKIDSLQADDAMRRSQYSHARDGQRPPFTKTFRGGFSLLFEKLRQVRNALLVLEAIQSVERNRRARSTIGAREISEHEEKVNGQMRMMSKLKHDAESLLQLAKGVMRNPGDAEAFIVEGECLMGFLENRRQLWDENERYKDARRPLHSQAQEQARQDEYHRSLSSESREGRSSEQDYRIEELHDLDGCVRIDRNQGVWKGENEAKDEWN